MKGNCGWCRRIGVYHKLCGYCGDSNRVVTVFVTRGRDVVNPVMVARLALREGEELEVPSKDLVREEPQYGVVTFDVDRMGTVHYTKGRRLRTTGRFIVLRHVKDDEWDCVNDGDVAWLRQLVRSEEVVEGGGGPD